MNSIRKILTDPSFWALVGINVLFIYEFRNNHSQYHTLIWLFWCQSILIGFFTFLDMVTTRNWKAEPVTNEPNKSMLSRRGCWPGFFVLHYGFFHLVYFIFLYAETPANSIDYSFIKYAMLGLLLTQVIFFTQQKIRYNHIPREIGSLLAMPYLRIVPMHLTILLPKFFDLKPAIVFLVLKAMLDVACHLITTKYYWVDELKPQINTRDSIN